MNRQSGRNEREFRSGTSFRGLRAVIVLIGRSGNIVQGLLRSLPGGSDDDARAGRIAPRYTRDGHSSRERHSRD